MDTKQHSPPEELAVGAPSVRDCVAGPLLTLTFLMLAMVFEYFWFPVPNVIALLSITVVYAAFTGGIRSGLASGLLAWLYLLLVFPGMNGGSRYEGDNLRRIVFWALALPAVAWMTGALRRRIVRLSQLALQRERAHCDALQDELDKRGKVEATLQRSREQLETRVSERTSELSGVNASLEAEIAVRKRYEQFLQNSEARKGAILDAALDGIVTMDANGRIIEFNPAAEKIFGWSREQMLGRELGDVLIPESRREQFRESLAEFRSAEKSQLLGRRLEMMLRRGDASEFPAEVSVLVVRVSSQPIFTVFVRDISERKKIETERAQLLDAERSARLQAETANRIKDEFLATISHELRTPLTALMGWVGLLRSGRLDAQRAVHAIEIIDKAAHTESALVEQLLDVTGIVAGKLRLDMQSLHLAPLIDAAVDSVRLVAQAQQVEIHTDYASVDEVVRSDAKRLQQVFSSLLNNAIKFSQTGGRVDVVLESAGKDVRVIISDTGVGIPAEFQPHLFERFRQADSSSTRQFGGLGLGLSIVRHLVEAHGGSVEISSPGTGLGTRVTILLPVQERRRKPKTRAVPLRGPTPLKGLHVLVVEDDPDTCEMVVAALKSFGAEVQSVHCAPEARLALKLEKPDVLVADVGMPGESGCTMLRKLRAQSDEQGGNIPAIALTAYTKPEDRDEALAAGFNLHVNKPVEPEKLSEAVANLAQTA